MPNDTTNTNTISDNAEGLLTAQNAKIQNLEAGLITQGQGLLNLESTQQQLLEKINTINLQLNTLNTLMQSNLEERIPDDLTIGVTAFPATALWTVPQAEVHIPHIHIFLPLKTSSVETNSIANLFLCGITCNYQCEWEINACVSTAIPKTTATIGNAPVSGYLGIRFTTETPTLDNAWQMLISTPLPPVEVLTGRQQLWFQGRVESKDSATPLQLTCICNKLITSAPVTHFTNGTSPTSSQIQVLGAGIYAQIKRIIKKY